MLYHIAASAVLAVFISCCGDFPLVSMIKHAIFSNCVRLYCLQNKTGVLVLKTQELVWVLGTGNWVLVLGTGTYGYSSGLQTPGLI